MKNYLCKKCGTLVQKSSVPNSSGCPEGSSHIWIDQGEVGNNNYQCKKCGTLIKSKTRPKNSSGCTKGASHIWLKL